MSAAEGAIQSLRKDVALQITKVVESVAATQIVMARKLGIPQPTLSKIVNGRVSDLSIELLLRVAIRAGLILTLQTGRSAEEAGAYLSSLGRAKYPVNNSKLAQEARDSLEISEKRLTPTERLEAFLQHNQLLSSLHQAGHDAERRRASAKPRTA
jgi:predicted XRE-type DNA-binding protein